MREKIQETSKHYEEKIKELEKEIERLKTNHLPKCCICSKPIKNLKEIHSWVGGEPSHDECLDKMRGENLKLMISRR